MIDCASAEHLAAALGAQAPAQMTLSALCKLVETAMYFNAIDLCKGIDTYIEPTIADMPLLEARLAF